MADQPRLLDLPRWASACCLDVLRLACISCIDRPKLLDLVRLVRAGCFDLLRLACRGCLDRLPVRRLPSLPSLPSRHSRGHVISPGCSICLDGPARMTFRALADAIDAPRTIWHVLAGSMGLLRRSWDQFWMPKRYVFFAGFRCTDTFVD